MGISYGQSAAGEKALSAAEARPPWEGDIPAIRREHLLDARLYADRWHMIDELGPAKLSSMAEVGVALGDFSKALIKRYDPDVFYAIDLFKLHEQEWLWDRRTVDLLEGKTHAEAYLLRMQAHRDRLAVRQGDGAGELAKLPDASLDLIYIDGSHHYADVARDGAVARKKIRPGGIVIFNDYILWSHLERMWYGIVPVVNDLVVNNGGKVLGLALQPNMYADIAIQM
jgi:hypothetical protein